MLITEECLFRVLTNAHLISRKVFLILTLGLLSIMHIRAQDRCVNSLNSLIDLICEPDLSFCVCSPIDLKGMEIQLPIGATIQIKKGKLFNGTLIGRNTRIVVDSTSCLGVVMKGGWISPTIDDRWFDDNYLDDNEIMSNINHLQSNEVNNSIYLFRNYEVNVDRVTHYAFVLSSNTSFHIHSTIKIKPNDYAKYGIIDISYKENVTVDGGVLIGDVGEHDYIPNSTSEWGMGYNVVTSRNISILNTKVMLCTGDGIYLGGNKEDSFSIYDNASRNIFINNVTCDKNRRQGLSIVHAKDVVIQNCHFINTGQVDFTNPGHGIDIEPNISHDRNMSVSDVSVIGCVFYGNKGKDISTAHYICLGFGGNIRNIKITKSKLNDEITIRSGSFIIDSIDVSRISVYLSINDMGDIEIKNSIIRGGLYLHSSVASDDHPEYTGKLENLVLSNCLFTNQEPNKGKYILALSGDMKRIKKLVFNDCEFVDKGFRLVNNKLINPRQLDACVLNNCIFHSRFKK